MPETASHVASGKVRELSSRSWSAAAFAGQSPASPPPDAAGGKMLRRRRLAVPLCTVLRAAGLPPLPATPQEREESGNG